MYHPGAGSVAVRQALPRLAITMASSSSGGQSQRGGKAGSFPAFPQISSTSADFRRMGMNQHP